MNDVGRHYALVAAFLATLGITWSGNATAQSAELVIPSGFSVGCNPCTATLDDGSEFTLAFDLDSRDLVQTLVLDGTSFEAEGGAFIYSDSMPPLYLVQFTDTARQDIFAMQGPSGSQITNNHYFLKTETGWTYLGLFPSLSYDKVSNVFTYTLPAGAGGEAYSLKLVDNRLVEAE